jgi:hypothetical protein
MWGTKINYRHMWAWGALVVEGTHEGRSRVRILAAEKRTIFTRKMSRLCSWQLFDLKSSCGPYRANWLVDGRQVLNVLRWRNYQNESYRSQKFMKLRSCNFLIWNHLVCHIGQIGLSAAHWPTGPKWPQMEKLPKWKLQISKSYETLKLITFSFEII